MSDLESRSVLLFLTCFPAQTTHPNFFYSSLTIPTDFLSLCSSLFTPPLNFFIVDYVLHEECVLSHDLYAGQTYWPWWSSPKSSIYVPLFPQRFLQRRARALFLEKTPMMQHIPFSISVYYSHRLASTWSASSNTGRLLEVRSMYYTLVRFLLWRYWLPINEHRGSALLSQ